MKQLRLLLALFCFEAFLAVLWIALTPSETGSAVILWFSRLRLLLLMAMLVLSVITLGVSIWLSRSDELLTSFLARLDGWFLQGQWLGSILIMLFLIPLLIAAGALYVVLTPHRFAAYRTWAPATFPLLHSIIVSVLPILLFVILVAIESGIYLAIRYREAAAAPQTWAWDHIGNGVLFTFIAVITVFHWIILAFQLRIFASNPVWYWKIQFVPFAPGDLLYALGALIFLILIYRIFILRRQILVGILLILILGWFLQIGVALMGDGGLAALHDRYFTTYHRVYVEKASESSISILDGIQRYEQVYGSNTFTGAKAPGLMAFYSGLEWIVNGHPTPYDDATRYERLSNAVMLLFPLIAVGMVVVLLFFARRLLDDPSGLVQQVSPVLYILAPNFVLLSFFADQALYPLVFLLGVWFVVFSIRRQAIVYSLVLGILLYITNFFSFSLLPLFVVVFVYLILHYRQSGLHFDLRRIIWHALAIAAGILMMYLLAMTFLNYDFFTRFGRSMAIHQTIDFYLRVGKKHSIGAGPLVVGLSQIINSAWINNLDLAAAVGFPVYVLFFVQAVRRIWRLFRGPTTPADAVLLTMIVTFVVMNLSGSTQGEVPRLWLFWLPMLALLASYELEPHLRRKPQIFLVLALMQLVTIILTFHFQDLRM